MDHHEHWSNNFHFPFSIAIDITMPENLISAVQERPALWDKRCKNYHNRLLAHREWEEVAKIINNTCKYI